MKLERVKDEMNLRHEDAASVKVILKYLNLQ